MCVCVCVCVCGVRVCVYVCVQLVAILQAILPQLYGIWQKCILCNDYISRLALLHSLEVLWLCTIIMHIAHLSQL